jgi:8-oxo-dGTP pyrophosphatase MutT (NUDIX family)
MDKQTSGGPEEITPWEVLNEKEIINTPYLALYEQQVKVNDTTTIDDYFVIKPRNGTCVVAITDDKQLLLVRQWRQGVRAISVEIPSGYVDSDTFEDAAKRELQEETGAVGGAWEYLGEIYDNPPKSTMKIQGFLAVGVKIEHVQKLDPSENIEIITIPVHQVKEYFFSGTMRSAHTVSFIGMALLKHPELFI